VAFRLVITIKQRVCLSFHALQKRFLCWVKPPANSLVLGMLTDLLRGKSELIAENALLRQQLTILQRQIKRPVYKKTDRLLLVLLASMARTWKQALYLIQPETLLLWHRELFRIFWKHKSKASSSKPELTDIMKRFASDRERDLDRKRQQREKLLVKRVQVAIQELNRQGKKVTLTAISQVVRLSLTTLQGYAKVHQILLVVKEWNHLSKETQAIPH
jgi:hypothetical protein